MALMNGVNQWKFQRLVNLLCVIAAIVLVCTLCGDNISSHGDLKALLAQGWVKVFFGVTLVLACLNSILAGWQIAGDYAHKIKVPSALITALVAIVSAGYAVWGLSLLF